MGQGYTQLIGGLFLLSYLALWSLLFYNQLKLDLKLIGLLVVLYVMAIFEGYEQLQFYRLYVGHWDARAFNFIIPAIAFMLSTVWLIRSLRRP